MPATAEALQGKCHGNLSSGWHFQTASFIAGNWEMLWGARTDGMARRQVSGQEARKLQLLELTKLACPCRILLDWHFSDGKFLSMSLWSSTAFEQRALPLPGWAWCIAFCAPRSGVAGLGQVAAVGQHGGLWHRVLSKGHLVTSTEALGVHSRKLGSHSISWPKSRTTLTQFLARLD